MKPCSRKPKTSSILHQSITTGPIAAKIIGSVRKLGHQYQDATIVLYNKENLQPISIKRPDQNGDYKFFGLNTDLKTFVVGFDRNQKFNAVIQDNVVPK